MTFISMIERFIQIKKILLHHDKVNLLFFWSLELKNRTKNYRMYIDI